MERDVLGNLGNEGCNRNRIFDGLQCGTIILFVLLNCGTVYC